MTEADTLREEITFLDAEIRSLRTRIGNTGNAVQKSKLAMLTRIRVRSAADLERVGS